MELVLQCNFDLFQKKFPHHFEILFHFESADHSLTLPPHQDKGRKFNQNTTKGWGRDKEITHLLLSWTKQTWLGEVKELSGELEHKNYQCCWWAWLCPTPGHLLELAGEVSLLITATSVAHLLLKPWHEGPIKTWF